MPSLNHSLLSDLGTDGALTSVALKEKSRYPVPLGMEAIAAGMLKEQHAMVTTVRTTIVQRIHTCVGFLACFTA